MSRLAGKVAIVTGGAGGIGAATARELAREEAAVAVVDIDQPAAVGVADESAARSVAHATLAEFGRAGVLNNNAALTTSSFLSRDTTVADLPLDAWQR
jgi:NAD(P)-dependent dehydrogenase (short-subunit alcohol dehydrogenase family)